MLRLTPAKMAAERFIETYNDNFRACINIDIIIDLPPSFTFSDFRRLVSLLRQLFNSGFFGFSS
jgi:hypothetical protein